jgi:integrase
MRGVRQTLGTAVDEAAPATIAQIRQMVYSLPDTTIGRRDRAVLLVGFAGALRRSELVAIDIDDLERRDEGIAVLLRRSKTDQEAQGRRVALPFGHDPQTCPVRALDAWLEVAHIDEGAVFRSVDRHGNVGARGLSDQSVALIVKRAAQRAGHDPASYSAHSLRAGFATSAAAAGASERAIAAQTGHQSMQVLRRYVRHGSLFTDNAVNDIGI